MTKEEYVVAKDVGQFYIIPPDQRNLNYHEYFEEGDPELAIMEEYNSDNTQLLTVEEIKRKLLPLKYVQQELWEWNRHLQLMN